MDHRRIAVIKPHEASWEAFLEDHEHLQNDEPAEAFDEGLDELFEHCIEEVRTVACELGIQLDIDEYELMPLHRGVRASTGNIVSRARSGHIAEANILTTINPSAEVMAYVMNCVQRSPLVRSIVGYSTYDQFEEALSLTRRVQTPMLLTADMSLPKLYPMPLDRQNRMTRAIIQDALLYPHGKTFSHARADGLIMPRESEIRHFED